MSEIEELAKALNTALGVLDAKGSAEEIAEYLSGMELTGGSGNDDCPVHKYLRKSVDFGPYACWVATDSIHVDTAKDGVYAQCHGDLVTVPESVREFIGAHDSQNRWGLDPSRPIIDNELVR